MDDEPADLPPEHYNDDPVSVGEIGLNAALAGHFGASVIMLSGDQMAAKEVLEHISPDMEVAVVKKGRGRYAADLTPLEKAREMICEAAVRGVRRLREKTAPAPMKLEGEVRLGLDFMYTHHADKAALLPGAERVGGTKVEFTGPDMPVVYRAMRSLVMLANA